MLPCNWTLFGQAREGIADGIHVDDAGRVWMAEGEGIVVRNTAGKVIGFNGLFSREDGEVPDCEFCVGGG